jgi:hypothetical protein
MFDERSGCVPAAPGVDDVMRDGRAAPLGLIGVGPLTELILDGLPHSTPD